MTAPTSKQTDFISRLLSDKYELCSVELIHQAKAVTTKADAMWPRIDSDYAQRSLTTTLHRLRKLLGDDSAITLQSGMLSLDASRFWLDL